MTNAIAIPQSASLWTSSRIAGKIHAAQVDEVIGYRIARGYLRIADMACDADKLQSAGDWISHEIETQRKQQQRTSATA